MKCDQSVLWISSGNNLILASIFFFSLRRFCSSFLSANESGMKRTSRFNFHTGIEAGSEGFEVGGGGGPFPIGGIGGGMAWRGGGVGGGGGGSSNFGCWLIPLLFGGGGGACMVLITMVAPVHNSNKAIKDQISTSSNTIVFVDFMLLPTPIGLLLNPQT